MTTEKQRIIKISDLLHKASTQVSILRNIAWPNTVKEEFFNNNAQKLPSVSYPSYDPQPVLQQIKTVRELIGRADSTINAWASRIANKIESSALLLSTRGSADFFRHSNSLFGKPSDPLQNGSSTIIDLACHFDHQFNGFQHIDLGLPPQATILATSMAGHIEQAVKSMFGDLAPEVVLDPSLTSNALAGRRRISIRPTARFTDKNVDQLIHHEAYIHVATSLNGHLQPHLKILGNGHAGTTTTQEGLAVFAEFITGSIDLDRISRLSDRVIAIQMAIDGADFIDIYRFYLEKTNNRDQSFQNAKRVFRGGLLTGKAPFTKDIVYLEGLLNVHNFLREALNKGKLDHLDLLFCGKLDISDLPALKQLFEMELVAKSTFLPPWIRDKRFLLSYLSYASFLNKIDAEKSKAYYEAMFE